MRLQERRNALRRKVRLPVLFWETTTDDRHGNGKEIKIRDISVDGLGFFCDQVYPLGACLSVDIYLPGMKRPVSSTIKVVSVEAVVKQEDYIIGTMFIDLGPEDNAAIAEASESMNVYVMLDNVIAQGASDLHLAVGCPPMIRKEGKIIPLGEEIINEGQVEAMLYPLLSNQQIMTFENQRELDFAFSPTLESRFRVNMHWQKGFVEAAFRNIPTTLQTLSDLGSPEATMRKFCSEKSGLILIAGTTGSGKTTTLSTMVNHINREKECVVITIEDPIEYIFTNQKSVIKQRELGSDTLSYAESLRRSLRQDPDVICVGEILDAECLSAALRAAETGHLVISTIHASSSIQAIERVINLFPPEHSLSVCQQLSSCLVGIVYQQLLTGSNGIRALASEILINNSALKYLIREKKYSQMKNVMQTGRSIGMYSLRHNLEELLAKSIIDEETLSEILGD